MAGFPTNSYYNRPTQLNIVTHPQSIFDDETLDDNILDGSAIDSGLEMSPAMGGSRHDSYPVSHAITSVKSEGVYSNSNNPYMIENYNNPFTNNMHSNAFVQQQQDWSMNNSGTCTPMNATFDNMQQQYHAQHQQSQLNAQHQAFFSPTTTIIDSMPGSPQSEEMNMPTVTSNPIESSRGWERKKVSRDGIEKNVRGNYAPGKPIDVLDAKIAKKQDQLKDPNLNEQIRKQISKDLVEFIKERRKLKNRQAA